MQIRNLPNRAAAFAAALALLVFSAWANADPPSRIARLGYAAGPVSFSPAGEDDWVNATVNRPLTKGDRLWTDAGARAEIQFGGAMVRMGADTSVAVLNLDNRITQLQMTQGTLHVRVRRLAPNQVFEINTPNLAFTVRQSGDYRIEVDPDGNATDVVVRNGKAEVYGEGAAYMIDARQPYRFMGTGLREYQYVDPPPLDAFDRWASARDRRYDSSRSARYVSRDVVGYQDLDAYGTWRKHPTYGNVWTPSRVGPGWAPYRDGHWAWVDPWGWTWVDDAPWGFAVSHYGRWANLGGTWGWVPAPVRSPAYYAPALVVFVGGANFQVAAPSGNVGGVAWFPLAPREEYRPSYPVSRGYYENINRGNTVVNNTVVRNTVINNTVVNNTYTTNSVTNVVYANRQVPGAVIAVPTTTFVQSQAVSRAAVRVAQQVLASAPVAVVAPVVPTQKSVRGAAASSDKPPAQVFQRPVVARTAPPAPQVSFAAQLPQLLANAGKPLDDAARKGLKSAAPVPVVRLAAAAPAVPAATPSSAPTSTDGKKVAPLPVVAAAPPMPPAAPAAAAKAKPLPRQAELPLSAAVTAEPPSPTASAPKAVTAQATAAATVAPGASQPVAQPAPAAPRPGVSSAAAPAQANRPAAAKPEVVPATKQAGPGPAPAAAVAASKPPPSPRAADAKPGVPQGPASAPAVVQTPRAAQPNPAPAAPAAAPAPSVTAAPPAPVPPRAADAKPGTAQGQSSAPVLQPPAPRTAQPNPVPPVPAAAAPPPVVVAPPKPVVRPASQPVPAQAAQGQPETAPAASQAAARSNAASAAKAMPQAQPQAKPKAELRSPVPRPRASGPVGKEKENDEQKREEEGRKPKG